MASDECSVQGCTSPVTARGWCATHYSRWRRTGEPGPADRQYQPRTGTCSQAECDRTVYAKGMCKLHYSRVWRGDPLDARIRTPRDGICVADGCDRQIEAQQLCANHYRSWRMYGDLDHVLIPIEGCDIEDCGGEHYALGMCEQHYSRFKRTGDPIKRTHGNNKGGYITPDGYKVVHDNTRRIFEHRLVMEQTLGRPLRDNENVHHRNGDRLDNRPQNLELWVKSQPCGQRVVDLVAWANEIIDTYGAEAQREKRRRKTL